MTNQEYLKSLYTKQLLRLRDAISALNSYDACYGAYPSDIPYKTPWGALVYKSEVLAELNTREHVPNKHEAKEIRRRKQLEKQNR